VVWPALYAVRKCGSRARCRPQCGAPCRLGAHAPALHKRHPGRSGNQGVTRSEDRGRARRLSPPEMFRLRARLRRTRMSRLRSARCVRYGRYSLRRLIVLDCPRVGVHLSQHIAPSSCKSRALPMQRTNDADAQRYISIVRPQCSRGIPPEVACPSVFASHWYTHTIAGCDGTY
jgi:hypothetical protein